MPEAECFEHGHILGGGRACGSGDPHAATGGQLNRRVSEMRKFKVKFALLLIALAAVVLGGWYLFAPGRTPPGQPPLTKLSPVDFNQLPTAFDHAAGNARLVLLLSPT
ncbi:MAG TPA: hypothetical protein VFK81_05970 [Terriglobales bacterium]|nr:hypothetical protein [Terriglobales bacterium]